jgi:hypothetical protein
VLLSLAFGVVLGLAGESADMFMCVCWMEISGTGWVLSLDILYLVRRLYCETR